MRPLTEQLAENLSLKRPPNAHLAQRRFQLVVVSLSQDAPNIPPVRRNLNLLVLLLLIANHLKITKPSQNHEFALILPQIFVQILLLLQLQQPVQQKLVVLPLVALLLQHRGDEFLDYELFVLGEVLSIGPELAAPAGGGLSLGAWAVGAGARFGTGRSSITILAPAPSLYTLFLETGFPP